ncbi:S46 family peptidase [Polyangium aurulentum]|uniref:S46 family peptidase n=1 Tax=Polyangium aurulentum TaxID=2567896 RepID=UPI0010AE716E|nr:S46 family peptidase [Polyangium aurulentum]UQA63425.1 S46 family peptidase [Polyangium aurulentum]
MSRLANRPTALALVVSFFGLGCGAEPAAPVETPSTGAPAAAAPASKDAQPTQAATQPAKKGFENPGGMWVPSQLAAQADTLRAAGWELEPKVLTDPTAPPLAAVVSLGGCTASFVSPDGLIVTNHHCVTRALQTASTAMKQNVIQNGFISKTRGEEQWAGPTSRVWVTRSFKDVTKDVREGLEKLPNDRARYDKIEERQKALVAGCEKDRPEIRCTVKSYFAGAQYLLIEQLEIRDVRLVYAPHEGVGNFGGEIDNWRWPRHSGDFSFLRAYVGKDQKPADHAETNVPYKPPHWLKLASKPLAPGDFVMVAGYPGTTNRLRTGIEIQEAMTWAYPRRIAGSQEAVKLLEGLSAKSEQLAIKANPMLRGVANGMKKMQGLSEGLGKGGVADKRMKLDADLKAWIEADPQRKAAYGDVLPKMEALFAEKKKTREEDALLAELEYTSSMLSAAVAIVHMAEERPKADAERDPDFQERNWKRIEQRMVAMTSSYDRTVDQAMFKLMLERVNRLADKERPAFMNAIVKAKADGAAIDKALGELYKTSLEDEKERVKLFKTAKLDDLKKSKDPMIKLALALRPAIKAAEDRQKSFDGAMSLLRPRYFEALQKMAATPMAPDANGTLRVTYGTVRGYSPSKDAPVFAPFTGVSEMVKKATGKDPFDAPTKLVDAAKAKKFGAYADASLGEVPVDFLSDLDITGGNSGSPTLNSKGELVGLAFDGNYEAMASDVIFLPEITRTIHVDLRYLMWVLDVDGADNVLTEMGVKPSIN